MWSTSPLSNAPPNSRRTSVRRVIVLDVGGRVRGSELESQHGPKEVRADRGQGKEPVHTPDEGKRQDEHRKVAIGSNLFRSEEHTSELQSRSDLVCRLLLEKKKKS